MAFKVLLTESKSAVGNALSRGYESQSLSFLCPEFTAEQWQNEDFVYDYLKEQRPAVIVNSMVFDRAFCEDAASANGILARVCKRLDFTIIHLSSHLVFAETQRNGEVLSEQDSPLPACDWGRYLLEAERSMADITRSVVVRLPWLLDGDQGIIYQLASSLLREDGVKTSEVWRGTPVFLDDVVRAVIAMVHQILCGSENWGVFHFHSSDSCSEAEFADYLARILYRSGCTVAPISVVKQEARLFPGNGWLVGNRCTNCFGIQFRSWRQGTKGRLESWLADQVERGLVQLRVDS